MQQTQISLTSRLAARNMADLINLLARVNLAGTISGEIIRITIDMDRKILPSSRRRADFPLGFSIFSEKNKNVSPRGKIIQILKFTGI